VFALFIGRVEINEAITRRLSKASEFFSFFSPSYASAEYSPPW
jgi:hypothetical protein